MAHGEVYGYDGHRLGVSEAAWATLGAACRAVVLANAAANRRRTRGPRMSAGLRMSGE
jgi:hypothetical protein